MHRSHLRRTIALCVTQWLGFTVWHTMARLHCVAHNGSASLCGTQVVWLHCVAHNGSASQCATRPPDCTAWHTPTPMPTRLHWVAPRLHTLSRTHARTYPPPPPGYIVRLAQEGAKRKEGAEGRRGAKRKEGENRKEGVKGMRELKERGGNKRNMKEQTERGGRKRKEGANGGLQIRLKLRLKRLVWSNHRSNGTWPRLVIPQTLPSADDRLKYSKALFPSCACVFGV